VPPLSRRPRPPSPSIDTQARRTVLLKGQRANISARRILELYREGECYPDAYTLLEQVADRYQLEFDALITNALREGEPFPGYSTRQSPRRRAFAIMWLERDHPERLLHMLPDAEFLTAVETAAFEIARAPKRFVVQHQAITEWLGYTDRVLRTSGLPYRLKAGTMNFEWVGDRKQHELTVQPALLALRDLRFADARAEFEDAVRRRRGGTPKDLQHAILEATKAVETVLKVLLRERGVTPPAKQQLAAMFNRLENVGVLPGYADHLIQAPGGPRNQVAHGEGASTPALADASIAAAATAITFLAHYLP
jgi:hypothetical protein